MIKVQEKSTEVMSKPSRKEKVVEKETALAIEAELVEKKLTCKGVYLVLPKVKLEE